MKVEKLEGLDRLASFSVLKSKIEASTKKELQSIAKKAKIQGFRPGKAPFNIVEQNYGGKAYEDSLNQEMNDCFVEILKTEKLDIVGYPKFELTSSEGESFEFTAKFEVMPEINLSSFETSKVSKFTCTVDNEVVEKTLTMLQKQRATYAESDKVSAKDDKVTIDFSGTVDGVEFPGGTATDYSFVLGAGSMLPDFENGVLGHKASETFNIDVSFPEEYHAENLKGKKAVFKISIKKVESPSLPVIDEEFIKSIGGHGTIDELKVEIKENLTTEVNRRLKVKMRESAFNELSKLNPIDVPNTLVHDEIHLMMDNAKENMKKQGYPEDQIKLTHDMFKVDAKRFVTLRLLIQKLIADEKFVVSDADVKAVVLEYAGMYDDAEDYVKWYYSDEQRLQNAKAIAMENKVIDFIVSKSKTEEVAVKYDELMLERI